MSAALVAGLVAGYGIAMPVGAVGAYLVALTARTSLRTGACAALGVASADGLYALISVTGGAALAPAIRPVTLPLHWASVVVLVALAGRGAVTAIAAHRRQRVTRGTGCADRTDRGDRELRSRSPVRAYLGLLGITMMNPVTIIYFAALVLASQGTVPGGAAPDHGARAVFVLAAFTASASWQLLLAGGGVLLGRVLTGPRGRLGTALVSSAVILGLAVQQLVSRS
ncbi:MAG TPA: LysE family transporter [Streptosporangiaceae bacterium]|nr:LysE family transporter [Streptosporangiaceae bacterium]